MDIETAARAAFDRLHELCNRRRNWDVHPDEDNGAEYGRTAFREMVGAAFGAVGVSVPAEPANDPAPPPEAA